MGYQWPRAKGMNVISAVMLRFLPWSICILKKHMDYYCVHHDVGSCQAKASKILISKTCFILPSNLIWIRFVWLSGTVYFGLLYWIWLFADMLLCPPYSGLTDHAHNILDCSLYCLYSIFSQSQSSALLIPPFSSLCFFLLLLSPLSVAEAVWPPREALGGCKGL